MTVPVAFVVELQSVVPPPLHGVPQVRWSFDSRNVEDLWLPKLGPTSWALLRLLGRAHDQPHEREHRFVTAAVAAALGTSPTRAWSSVERLVRFRMLDGAPSVDPGEPRFVLRPSVAPLTGRDFDRLPAVVRERFAGSGGRVAVG